MKTLFIVENSVMIQTNVQRLNASINMINSIRIDCGVMRGFMNVQDAVLLANHLLQNKDFYDRIAHHPGFDLANVPPKIISLLMRKTSVTMHIDLYHALSPIKNYDGYDDLTDPSLIHLNIWKTDRSAASICNTIIHNCVHAVNAHHKQYNFGHGDMLLQGKENTAPYWIGALAQEMVSKEDLVIIPLEHDPYEPQIKDVKKLYSYALPIAK